MHRRCPPRALSSRCQRRCRSSGRKIRSARAAARSVPASAPTRAFGPSPSVIAAMNAAAPEKWKYCDPDNHDLKAALADALGVRSRTSSSAKASTACSICASACMSSPATPSSPRSAPIRPSTSTSPASAAGWLRCLMRTTARDLDGLLAAVRRENASARLSLQSRQSDGHMVGGRRNHPLHRGAARDHDVRPRRGLWRDRPGIGAAAARHRAAERASACAPSPRPTGLPAYAAATRSASGR